MTKLSFIKLDIEIMNDSKIKMIRKMPDGAKLFELWIGLLCLGMKSGRPGCVEIGDGIPFNARMLSAELDIPESTIEFGLQTFTDLRMIERFDDYTYFLTNFEKHQELEKIEIKRINERDRKRKYREKVKLLSHGTVQGQDADETNCPAVDIDTDTEEEKEKEEEINIVKKTPKAELAAQSKKNTIIPQKESELYQSIWKTFLSKNDNQFTDYPKEGKAVKALIKKAETRFPDDPKGFIKTAIEKYFELIQGNDKYWSKHPFIPSRLNSSGVWDSLLVEMQQEQFEPTMPDLENMEDYSEIIF